MESLTGAVTAARRLIAVAEQRVQDSAVEALRPVAEDLRRDLTGAVSRAPSAYAAVYGRLADAVRVEPDTRLGVAVTIPGRGGVLQPGGALLGQVAFGYEYGAKAGDLVRGAGSGEYVRVRTTAGGKALGKSRLVRADSLEAYRRKVQQQTVFLTETTTTTKTGKVRTRRKWEQTVSRRAEVVGAARLDIEKQRGSGSQFPPLKRKGWWVNPTVTDHVEDVVTAFVVAVDKAIQGVR